MPKLYKIDDGESFRVSPIFFLNVQLIFENKLKIHPSECRVPKNSKER